MTAAFHRLIAVVILAALLGACVGPVPKVDAPASRLAAIKTVAIIRPPEPETYTVVYLGHPGMAFGLIGGLIAAGDQSAKQDKLTTALKARGAAFTSRIAQQLVIRLSALGYEAKIENGPWERKDGRFVLAYDKIKSDADAVLIVIPTQIGFVATWLTSDYMPTITVAATLLGKDRKEPIYRGFHAYGWTPPVQGWKVTAPKTTFPNFQALISNPKAAADALNEASVAIAGSVSADLRR